MIAKMNYNSRVTEVNATSALLVGAYNNSGISTDENLSSIVTSLNDATQRLTLAVNRSKSQSILDEKDLVRDEKYRDLFYLIHGLTRHPSAEIKAAAEKISQVIDHYGLSVTGESYAVESSLISSLLKDLEKPAMQTAAETLSGCTDLIDALKIAQNEFEQNRIAYEEQKADESTEISATKLKKEVFELVNNKLVVYLRAMLMINEPVYGNLSRTVAEIIDTNNIVVKKRQSKSELVE